MVAWWHALLRFGLPHEGASADARTLSPANAGAPPKGEPFGCVEANIFRRGDHWSPALLRFGLSHGGASADARTLSPADAGAPPKGEPFGCAKANIFRRGDHLSPALPRVQTAAKNPSGQQQRQRLPCVKGAAPQGLRDCRPQHCAAHDNITCRRQSLRLALRRSTSLYTREAFVVVSLWQRGASGKWASEQQHRQRLPCVKHEKNGRASHIRPAARPW